MEGSSEGSADAGHQDVGWTQDGGAQPEPRADAGQPDATTARDAGMPGGADAGPA